MSTDDPTAYPKIPGPFWRDPATNLLTDRWSSDELDATKNLLWRFTEKVDGMNIRVIWDGHRVTFAGRTLRASIPGDLVNWLTERFGGEERETLFEQKFGAAPVVLYGEGFGGKIQSGAATYGPEKRVVFYDVLVDGRWWLRGDDLADVCLYFGVEKLPALSPRTLRDAIADLREAPYISNYGDFPAEGLIGTTAAGLRGRNGDRLIVKLKTRDLSPR